MIIRLFLKLFAAALVILIIADVFYELHLNWLSNLIVKLGDEVLLLAVAFFLISGGIFLARRIKANWNNYFSASEKAKRQVLFNLKHNAYLQRLFSAKKKHVLYFAQVKRQHLLQKDNKKQCRLLAKALLNELKAVKGICSADEFNTYQQAIKHASANQQIERLLELQTQLSALH
jgi:hypothetical protein